MTDDSATTDGDRPLLSPDALAGVVDLFGALTRTELRDAIAELAFKRGAPLERDAVERAIDDAVAGYALVVVDGENGGEAKDGKEAESGGGAESGSEDEPSRLAVGPTAFPTLPDGAADLPHILDFDGEEGAGREIDREAVATAVEGRLRREAARAAAEGDDARLETLLDVCFDVDVWAGVDTGDVRADIERALE